MLKDDAHSYLGTIQKNLNSDVMKNDTKSAKKVMNFPPKTNQGACVKVLTVVLSLDWWATLRG